MQFFVDIKCEREWECGGAEEGIFEGNLCATCAGSISLLPVQTLSSVLLRHREWCPLYTPHHHHHAEWLRVCSKSEKCLILELYLLPTSLIRPHAFA